MTALRALVRGFLAFVRGYVWGTSQVVERRARVPILVAVYPAHFPPNTWRYLVKFDDGTAAREVCSHTTRDNAAHAVLVLVALYGGPDVRDLSVVQSWCGGGYAWRAP